MSTRRVGIGMRAAFYFGLAWTFAALSCTVISSSTPANGAKATFCFTGDVMLSRNVAPAVAEARSKIVRAALAAVLNRCDFVCGALEGAVGPPSSSAPNLPPSLCFAVPEPAIASLRSIGFKALSLETNHSLDLGEDGRRATVGVLKNNAIAPLEFETSPFFFKARDLTVAVIPLSLIDNALGQKQELPGGELLRKLRLASRLADLVIIMVHWGAELHDWVSPLQQTQAEWLIANGADIIVGSHPHVVIDPVCLDGKAVYYSLGNFIFDQKYEPAKHGMLAMITLDSGARTAQCLAPRTRLGADFSVDCENAEATDEQPAWVCQVDLRQPITLNGITVRARSVEAASRNEAEPSRNEAEPRCQAVSLEGWRAGVCLWRSPPRRLISLTTGKLKTSAAEDYLLAVEKHFSPIDGESAPRPYVYRVSQNGLEAIWRGSALAWPLIDATLLGTDPCLLCALHRADSFLVLDRGKAAPRAALYRWNGFGFTGVDDAAEQLKQCEAYFSLP